MGSFYLNGLTIIDHMATGANVRAVDISDSTPLSMAEKHNHTNVVRLLMDAGELNSHKV